jgi:6-phospho-3-hexuloisomerase
LEQLEYIRNVLTRVEADAIRDLADHVLQAERVFLAGSGRSGLVLQMFATRLAQLGLSPQIVGQATTTAIKAGDLLVAASGTGKTEGVVMIARQARRAGALVHAIVAVGDSPLSQAANRFLLIPTGTSKEGGKEVAGLPLGTAFEECLLLLLDGLVHHLASRIGLDEGDMRQRHANLE